jgi:hypothetical protein
LIAETEHTPTFGLGIFGDASTFGNDSLFWNEPKALEEPQPVRMVNLERLEGLVERLEACVETLEG